MTSEPAAAPSLAGLPDGWTARPPELTDLNALADLRGADKEPWTGSRRADREAVESEIAGPASWTRRQLVLVDAAGEVRAWVVVHDRAARRTMLHVYVDRTIEGRATQDALAACLYAWAEEQAAEICALREVAETRMDASPFEADVVQREWLASAGYTNRRTYLQMTRPVTPDEATSLPGAREGVTIRRVASHDNGLPVAADLVIVHEMLEKSFEDHFNSYRESFPEFVQRLREDPGHRWDHWWVAFVEIDGVQEAAGALVSTVLPENAARPRGQLRRLHRRAPQRPRARGGQVAAAHRDRRRGGARPRPGRARGRRVVADRGRRPLPRHGLGDRLRHRVVVQGHRLRVLTPVGGLRGGMLSR